MVIDLDALRAQAGEIVVRMIEVERDLASLALLLVGLSDEAGVELVVEVLEMLAEAERGCSARRTGQWLRVGLLRGVYGGKTEGRGSGGRGGASKRFP